MRSEKEMLNLILDIADRDDRIIAAYMNGSRTNENITKDIFQDYDIVYVVKETKSFIDDKAWIDNFGEILYMQYPDEHPDYPGDKENFYGWLMQFRDGNRIDLHIETLRHALENIHKDRLCKVLLDKEDRFGDVAAASDVQYHIKRPSEAQFAACCNEFWWCTNNLAKGLWREEITYVHDMADFIVRKQLEKMLVWKIGVLTDYGVSVGKSAKYMKNWLEPDEYAAYLGTYFDGSTVNAWEAVLTMCALFSKTAVWVAKHLNFAYNRKEADAAMSFLEHVRVLPEDAKEIY